MNDLISRQAALREYQKVCNGIKCGECPFLIKVNTEKGSHLITDCKLEAFLHNIPSAQPELKWIPIDKSCPNEGELPDIYSNVFVSTGDYVFMAYRSGYSGYWYISGLDITFSRELNTVDAWMPLPEPYKEVKNEQVQG